MWFNNVETRPGPGYPRGWEDQDHFKGGWTMRNGKLRLKAGGAVSKLATIFHNPHLPTIDDYYEPWTYDYENLTTSPRVDHQPVARPRSLITGELMDNPVWGPNWDDDLAGGRAIAPTDPNFKHMENHVAFEYEQTFMMYLPRICEHCLNPACVAACPTGAIYKRDEDGIVLVDQDACRGWRFCVSACPYKKVYFNWNTHKAEKCNFCYPRVEAGLPTICSETCVGRIRYLGPILYDADRIREAASVEDVKDLYPAQLNVFLDPNDPEVIEEAHKAGINDAWLDACRRSPVYKMAIEWKVALPLHPEYRTLPMVWYVPPLSPIMNQVQNEDEMAVDAYLPTVDQMRIPMEYLASLLTAGDVNVIRNVLIRLTTMRAVMREKNVGDLESSELLKESGLTMKQVEEMARMFGVAKYHERFVIPTRRTEEETEDLEHLQGACSIEELAPSEGRLPQLMRVRTGKEG
jgi:nitrate reductase / nitrite oxidoreductase, beta subunit